MNAKETDEFLDMTELLLGASVALEAIKKTPEKQLIIEHILAIQILHWKRLGYDVQVEFPKKRKNGYAKSDDFAKPLRADALGERINYE